jgi:hypothetical protein
MYLERTIGLRWWAYELETPRFRKSCAPDEGEILPPWETPGELPLRWEEFWTTLNPGERLSIDWELSCARRWRPGLQTDYTLHAIEVSRTNLVAILRRHGLTPPPPPERKTTPTAPELTPEQVVSLPSKAWTAHAIVAWPRQEAETNPRYAARLFREHAPPGKWKNSKTILNHLPPRPKGPRR